MPYLIGIAVGSLAFNQISRQGSVGAYNIVTEKAWFRYVLYFTGLGLLVGLYLV